MLLNKIYPSFIHSCQCTIKDTPVDNKKRVIPGNSNIFPVLLTMFDANLKNVGCIIKNIFFNWSKCLLELNFDEDDFNPIMCISVLNN